MMVSLNKKYIINTQYEIKHFVEKTTYNENYTAKKIDTDSLVTIYIYNAAKIARDDIDNNGDLKEIRFLKMAIKGFPKYIDDGEFIKGSDKYRFIVTDFVSGESVLDRMRRLGPYNEYDAISIIIQLLNVTSELHSLEEPILFNGLTLDNLLIDMSGSSEKIVIRNIKNVRLLSETFKYKFIDGVNPNFLAPEVFNNVFTPKSDLYNIGTLLYNLICGITPWYVEINKTDYFSESSIDNIFDSRSKPLDFSVNNLIDEHVKLTLTQSLAQNVDKRFNSSDDFLKALNREVIFSSKKEISESNHRKPKGKGFKDIAGMVELKTILKKEVIDVIKYKEKYEKYGLTIPNGMLLYGPPGCGKTFISEKFAEEVGFTFISIKPSDLGSIYVHGAQEKIGNLFADAEKNSPSIIFFDEVDAIMPARGSGTHQGISAEVNEFLAQMTECSKRGIFVIAATNQPELIDEAILRTGRIDRVYYVSNPDFEAREKMFELYLKDRYCEIGLDYKQFAELTNNYVSSDIKYAIDQASREAADKDLRISNKILIETLNNFRPSVSIDVINKYLKIKEKLENPSSGQNKRTKIGF